MAIPILGDIWNAVTGAGAAKEQRKATKSTQKIANQQAQMMQQAAPYMQALMQWYAQNAGLQLPGMGGATPGIAGPQGVPQTQPMAPRMPTVGQPGFGVRTPQSVGALPNTQMQDQAQTIMGGGPSLPNSALGIYGQNPADVFRLQQAEEDVNRLARQRAQMLQYRMGQQGMGNSATMGAALGANERDAFSQLANFRRQLAIQSGQEQQNRMAQLGGMLNLPMSGGQQAAQLFQNLAGQYGQQSQGMLGQLGDLAGNYFLSRYLKPKRTDITL